jgi:hypothetical protein
VTDLVHLIDITARPPPSGQDPATSGDRCNSAPSERRHHEPQNGQIHFIAEPLAGGKGVQVLGTSVKAAMCLPVPLPGWPSSMLSHRISPRFSTIGFAASNRSNHLSSG